MCLLYVTVAYTVVGLFWCAILVEKRKDVVMKHFHTLENHILIAEVQQKKSVETVHKV